MMIVSQLSQVQFKAKEKSVYFLIFPSFVMDPLEKKSEILEVLLC